MTSSSAAATRLLLFAEGAKPGEGPDGAKLRRYRMARLSLADGGRAVGAPRYPRVKRAR